MGCCDGDEKDENSARRNKKHANHKDFKETSDRFCTDIICLIIWIVCMIAMIVIAGYALANGNLDYISYPVDYLDQFCGKTGGVANRHKIFYPQLDKDIQDSLPLLLTGIGILSFRPYGLCVTDCPETFSLADPIAYGGPTYPGANPNASETNTFYNLRKTATVLDYCLPTTQTIPAMERKLCGVPNCTDPVLNASIMALGGTLSCATIDATPSVSTAWEVSPAEENLCKFLVVEKLAATFVPPDYTDETGPWEQTFATFVTGTQDFFHEVWKYRAQCGIMGFAAPFAIGFVWFLLLFLFAGLLVALALIVALLSLVGSCFYLYAKAGLFDVNDIIPGINGTLDNALQPDENRTAYIVFSVLATIGLLLFLIFLAIARHNIWRCIAIVRETTKVFYSIPLLAAYPLVPITFNILLVFYTVLISAFIWTGEQTSWDALHTAVLNLNSTAGDDFLDELGTISANNRKIALLVIHIVGCIWIFWFANACAYTTYAGVGARWFFSHENGVLGVRFFFGFGTILDSAWCVISRHLGTMAFGSAIMTIITLIRLIFEYIDQKTKDLQADNKLLSLVMCCIKCCLNCVYQTIKSITEYGYIFTAVEGKNFCSSCWSTFELASRNPSQVLINRMVGAILEVMIEFSIPIACSLLGFAWCDSVGSTKPIWPAVFIFITSFTISSGVGDVFRCMIDTIYLCAWKDMHTNNPPFFMSESLQSGFGIEQEASPEEVKLNRDVSSSEPPRIEPQPGTPVPGSRYSASC